jgi:DNA-directed RNA polymerase specialized sigma24 family protein
MMAASHCDCLVCRLEATLVAELSDDRSSEEFRKFAASSQILIAFPTALDLVQQLHRYESTMQNPSSEDVLLDLLTRSADIPFRPMWQRLFLLVFIPTIHRTTSQITSAFPSLTRDDTAQHLFAVLLEFLHSQELQSRRSHLAFTIARKIRRSTFRWAIRESRIPLATEGDIAPSAVVETAENDGQSHSGILLAKFLDDCQRRGWLSPEERALLTQFKIEGITGPELASRNGHSAVAIRHRVQRILRRLQRIAQTSGDGTPEQMNLFLP